nr:pre-mRNA-splicing factor SLU7-like [Dermatophagoides farinae]
MRLFTLCVYLWLHDIFVTKYIVKTMNVPSRPVSEIIKSSDNDEPIKRSRADWKKAKELEEARKLGQAPAEVDEEGKDINPHIPQYISTTPWYYGAAGPTLKHQKVFDDKNKNNATLHDKFVRGLKGRTATKFRKGACENCGAMGHKKKECFERLRSKLAKYTGEDIVPDDVLLPKLKYDYDGKRDRCNGYDPVMYRSVIEEHRKVEEAKQILKEEKLEQDSINTEGNSDEDEKYADHIYMSGTKVDSKQRITVRNLRIREDTAKYLRNLDIDSAYYDPKTRSMRDNPYKHTGKTPEELHYAGDNFIRYMGETQKVSQAQLFAWEMSEKGVDIHLQAEPTKAEMIHRELDLKMNDLKETTKESILNKYGGKDYLEVPPNS